MRFESKLERDNLIKSFEEKTKLLTEEKSKEKGIDPNYNCKVTFDTRSEYDEISYKEEKPDEIKECKGDIYVFYIRQPKLLDTIKILGSMQKDNIYTQCLLAWDAMIIKEESSPEVFKDRIKLGYLLEMPNHIDALLSDQKKS